MRTTITLNDALLDDLKCRAAERQISLSQVIDDLLRIAIAQEEKAAAEPRRFNLTTSGGQGPFPRYEKVWDLIDVDDIERMRRDATA